MKAYAAQRPACHHWDCSIISPALATAASESLTRLSQFDQKDSVFDGFRAKVSTTFSFGLFLLHFLTIP
jgi:hypothetical protein